ncbi:hypothetical protein [Micromonospora zhanjiangensis]|uniref:Uncharacterized protein n=1 Tax=Micromonospora zhanjiangensis TaxID=1522057 RepID=A0ABV8KHU5_9ACTN
MPELVRVGDLLTIPAGKWKIPRRFDPPVMTIRVSHVTQPGDGSRWVSLVGVTITDQLAVDGVTRNLLVDVQWLRANPPLRPDCR